MTTYKLHEILESKDWFIGGYVSSENIVRGVVYTFDDMYAVIYAGDARNYPERRGQDIPVYYGMDALCANLPDGYIFED